MNSNELLTQRRKTVGSMSLFSSIEHELVYECDEMKKMPELKPGETHVISCTRKGSKFYIFRLKNSPKQNVTCVEKFSTLRLLMRHLRNLWSILRI